MAQEYRISVDDGNFTFVAPVESDRIDILRRCKPWGTVEDPNLTWPLFALMCELHAARGVLIAARQFLKTSTEDLAPIMGLRRAVEPHDRSVADHEAATAIAHEAPNADETAALQGRSAYILPPAWQP